MNSKRLAGAIGVILALGISSAACGQQSPSQTPADASAASGNAADSNGQVRLHLTEDQREKIKGIRQSQTAQIQATRDDNTLTGPEKRQKIQQIRQQSEQQIEALLAPDQLAAWKQLHSGEQSHPPRASHAASGAASPSAADSGANPPIGNVGPASTPPSPD
ncbi:MAG TPA: hypothetical protein VMU43_07920 [Candidatus Acidoferrum sp.]|nr:hypothetical protein [Candidatus Acidoferrum sp.]